MRKEASEKRQYICWMNEQEKILSFHHVEGYLRMDFQSKKEFHEFILFTVSCGYRVQ